MVAMNRVRWEEKKWQKIENETKNGENKPEAFKN